MFVIFQFVSRGSKHDGKAFGSVWGVRVVAGDHDVNKCVCVIIYVCTQHVTFGARAKSIHESV
jgi:hypothetical protein